MLACAGTTGFSSFSRKQESRQRGVLLGTLSQVREAQPFPSLTVRFLRLDFRRYGFPILLLLRRDSHPFTCFDIGKFAGFCLAGHGDSGGNSIRVFFLLSRGSLGDNLVSADGYDCSPMNTSDGTAVCGKNDCVDEHREEEYRTGKL